MPTADQVNQLERSYHRPADLKKFEMRLIERQTFRYCSDINACEMVWSLLLRFVTRLGSVNAEKTGEANLNVCCLIMCKEPSP